MTLSLTKSQPSPIQSVDKHAIADIINRVKTMVPDVNSIENLTAIAQESILFRTVPGRDMHYYEKGGKLQRIPDYKYLKNYASFKEKMMTGDQTVTIEETYKILSDADKSAHGIPLDFIASACTITTDRERKAFAAEVKRWVEVGFAPKDALELARETYGDLGTTKIGVVSTGGKMDAPQGWSPLQKAEKLAFKNAINAKYGQPTADEMQAMAHLMARQFDDKFWDNDLIDQPIEVQARHAQLVSWDEEAKEKWNAMSAEEQKAKKVNNVNLMRGRPGDDEIGDDWQDAEIVEAEPQAAWLDKDEFWADAMAALGIDQIKGEAILQGAGLVLGSDTAAACFEVLAEAN